MSKLLILNLKKKITPQCKRNTSLTRPPMHGLTLRQHLKPSSEIGFSKCTQLQFWNVIRMPIQKKIQWYLSVTPIFEWHAANSNLNQIYLFFSLFFESKPHGSWGG